MPVPQEILKYHRACLEKPEKQRGRTGDYQTIVDDIFSISHGWLVHD